MTNKQDELVKQVADFFVNHRKYIGRVTAEEIIALIQSPTREALMRVREGIDSALLDRSCPCSITAFAIVDAEIEKL